MKFIYLIFLTLLTAASIAYAQNDDIPVETDNQFPPDHSESDGLIEGSGAGVVEEPNDVTTEIGPTPALENMESTSIKEMSATVDVNQNPEDETCPKPCVCSIEGESNNYIVDCSGYGLTEFPAPIDPKTTTLNLHNNKLTEIPKEVSALKNLKVLNANNNQIMELIAGSVSELPELVTLKLANNRLIEYPKDLKNSISLTKLEELDLGGNDMRTSLSSELFSNFISLRKLTLPTEATTELVLDLCGALKETLETVCTESCDVKTFDCPDAPQKIDDDLLDAALPGMISLNGIVEDNNDPSITTETKNAETESTESSQVIKSTELPTTVEEERKDEQSVSEFSLRTAVNNAAQEVSPLNNVVEVPKENQDEVKIGAKTSDSAPGGVNKSIIGMIVAGMIVVVAGITIKKNWSSIKKRFSSSPRPNERNSNNANGTTPEEVPLQEKPAHDKSPV